MVSPRISGAHPEVCTNSTVHFADSSVSDGLHVIQKWQWDYGDGATETLNAVPFQHTYTLSGSYTVKLTVTDNLGCADTRIRQHAVIISRPVTQSESLGYLSVLPDCEVRESNNRQQSHLYLVFWRWATNCGPGARPYLYQRGHVYG